MWPPAPGVWLLLGILAAIILVFGRYFFLKWKRNAYRRAGLVLLDLARTGYDVSVVLKRVALAVFPREQVASLYGADWIAFLNRHCARSRFEAIEGSMDADTEASPELIIRAGAWIRHHNLAEQRVQGEEI
jgi:hypothetical protein